jgi:hypothetical protein
MVALFWEVSFRVSASQDRLTRYGQVKTAHPVPVECVDDEAQAHQQIEDLITANGEPTKPYAVYTQGWRDDVDFSFTARIDPNA